MSLRDRIVDMTEKDWQRQLVELARLLGWERIYHTHTSKHSQAGFPDLVLVRDRVIYLELKTETGNLTRAQLEWLTALFKAGAETYVARPADFELVAKILTHHARDASPANLAVGEAAALRFKTRQELAMPDVSPSSNPTP